MTTLESDLDRIGNQLQTAWRAEARHARRKHRRTLLASATLGTLALAGAAIAASEFPISLTSASSKPASSALVQLRAFYGTPPSGSTKPWTAAWKLDLGRATAIAQITSRDTGPLTVIVVPATDPHGVCLDAARPDGSSYLSACAQPSVAFTRLNGAATYNITTGFVDKVGQAPLNISLHSAPANAARIDVRARNGSKLPAIISHGWIFYVNAHPGPAVLVRAYGTNGKRVLHYYGN